MTFSDPEVRRVLDEEFVATWYNQAADLFPGTPAGPSDRQPEVSEHYLRTFPDGGGGSNVRIFFCTPDARIVHSIEGYYRPQTFLQEVAFARELLAAAASPPTLAALHADRHAAITAQIEGLRSPAAGQDPAETKQTRALLHVLRANLANGSARLLDVPDRYMINESRAIA